MWIFFCNFQNKSDLEITMSALEAQLKQEKEKYLDASNKNTQVCKVFNFYEIQLRANHCALENEKT